MIWLLIRTIFSSFLSNQNNKFNKIKIEREREGGGEGDILFHHNCSIILRCLQSIFHRFQIMASNIGLYGAFLHNYARATDTVRRCSAHSTQFGEITRDIRLRGFPKGPGLSLEDLLHKPVARVQKNALVLHVSTAFDFKIDRSL